MEIFMNCYIESFVDVTSHGNNDGVFDGISTV